MHNIFEEIPESFEEELFERLLKNENITIERIVSRGHKSPNSGWHDQDKNEWVVVLKGEALLLFNDKTSVTLKTGDFINIEAHRKHKVEWTDPNTETVWLAVHY